MLHPNVMLVTYKSDYVEKQKKSLHINSYGKNLTILSDKTCIFVYEDHFKVFFVVGKNQPFMVYPQCDLPGVFGVVQVTNLLHRFDHVEKTETISVEGIKNQKKKMVWRKNNVLLEKNNTNDKGESKIKVIWRKEKISVLSKYFLI